MLGATCTHSALHVVHLPTMGCGCDLCQQAAILGALVIFIALIGANNPKYQERSALQNLQGHDERLSWYVVSDDLLKMPWTSSMRA